MRRFRVNFHLTTLFFLLSIFMFSGCAKKVVKVEEMGKTAKEEGPGIKVGKIIEGDIMEETHPEELEAGKAIEGALEELLAKTKEPIPGEEIEGRPGLGVDKLGKEFMEERRAVLEKIDELAKKEAKLLPIYFDFDRYSIREDARETLKDNAVWLIEHPRANVLIEGHADERGSNEYNLALGDRRAKIVKDYLSDLGVEIRPSTVTFGEERPVCIDSGENCWSRNRRAEFVIVSD